MTAMRAPDQSFDFTPGHKRDPWLLVTPTMARRRCRACVRLHGLSPFCIASFSCHIDGFLALIVMTGVSGPLWARRTGRRAAAPTRCMLSGYGTAPGCPVSFLVQGGPNRSGKVDLAMTFLGTERPRRADGPGRWPGSTGRSSSRSSKGSPTTFDPTGRSGDSGSRPEEVTDVIVTHMHSDHFDGVDLFPKATVWIQKDEFNHYTREVKPPSGKAAPTEPDDVAALVKLNKEGRVRLVDGDAKEILPGSDGFTSEGKHTFASQYVGR